MSGTLSPEDRLWLETLFDRAADLPRAEHAAFLENECGSSGALRDELARLLEGLVGEDILERLQVAAPLGAGTRIGPYEVQERVGEGGMGEVYSARQLKPVDRRVALKIIKLGMDSAQVVARFKAERQALARMTHPNVAQIFDGGVTETGRPYFVMEFVAGESITEHCNREKLSTRERLELFLGVCEGVRHAHQKGIIHRDLKPSNLLVTPQNGQAVPKVIDFGVARATTGSLAERTLHTLLGQIVGTLDYMSPEQADPGGVDIDTRSDIYSLGVVLYQLLCGLLPFDHALEPDRPLSELQKAIREKNPPTPSTRLRRMTGTAIAIAPLHATDGRSLVRQLSGDLDWICLKALEKDPARRYQSVSELAEDLRRHLANEPVLAGRPDTLYRARKFVRRHRVAVTAGALAALATIAGLVGIISSRLEVEAGARELERYSDGYLAQRLAADAASERLWPPHPEKIPDLEEWLLRSRRLFADIEDHREALARVRRRARPSTSAERSRDRETHPRANELTMVEAKLEARIQKFDHGLSGKALDQVDQEIASLELEQEALEAEVDVRRTWTFDSSDGRWRHDLLSELVENLEELGSVPLAESGVSEKYGWSVPKRLALARKLEAGFAEGGSYDQAWSEALPRINAAYPKLNLKPQVGLLPLGLNEGSGRWEFAHLMTGDPAKRGPDGRFVVAAETGLVLILLRGGEFWMGAQHDDVKGKNYDPDASDLLPDLENPVHRVHVPPFFISKYEMTRGQWRRVVGSGPRDEEGPADSSGLIPVSGVSWNECDRTTRQMGLVLPSEEQWEYAARGGTETVWWTGDEAVSLKQKQAANLFDQTGARQSPGWSRMVEPVDWEDGFLRKAPVGTFAANPFGLHEVHGNVMEWCSNHPYLYSSEPGDERVFPFTRAARGGSSRGSAIESRSAFRRNGPPELAAPALGLRPAREIDPR